MQLSFEEGLNLYSLELIESLKSTYQNSKPQILQLYKELIGTTESGNKIFFCGNGGSFADAQHIVGELVVRFKHNRKAIAAECLGTNSTILSAISNDLSFDLIFSRELEANSNPNDLLICLSTSGKSKNILNALNVSNELNLKSWLITGKKNNHNFSLAHKTIFIDSSNTPIIQEVTVNLMHYLCAKVEEYIVIK